MGRKNLFLLALLPMTSCATPRALPTDDPFCGWNENTRQMARDTYFYAQLANNAYKDDASHPRFTLPNARLIEQGDNAATGFAYAVYERERTGRPERILAFRGTEGLFGKDMWYGNLLPRQNVEGLKLYRAWQLKSAGYDLNVTGHSLGGGIATQVTLCFDKVDGYFFNSSPNFRRCKPVNYDSNKRISVVEYGEILKVARIFGRSPSQQYNSLGCTYRAGPGTQHGIRALAECLTRIAAAAGDEGAIQSLAANPAIPKDCWPRSRRGA